MECGHARTAARGHPNGRFNAKPPVGFAGGAVGRSFLRRPDAIATGRDGGVASPEGRRKVNAERHKIIATLAEKLRAVVAEIEQVRDDEQQAFDNLPEGFQQSERGQASEQAVTDLESAVSNAESAADDLEGIV